jgi:hypothetical protein
MITTDPGELHGAMRDMFRPQADCLDREGKRIDETIPLPGGPAAVAAALGVGDHE